MDVINEKALFSDTISPAIDKLRAEIVPALALALDGRVEQISNVLRGVLQGIQATEDKAAADVATLIGTPSLRELLDGFTLTITPQGPIATITGPIIITLGTPPKKEQQP